MDAIKEQKTAVAPDSEQNVRPSDSFSRHVLTLFSGTAVAQFAPVVFAPVLTRVFSPGEFGVFGVFFSCITICATIVTLRFSHAILLPESHSQAAQVSVLCLVITIMVSLLVAALSVAHPMFRFKFLEESRFSSWSWVLPISTLLAGTQAVFYTIANRERSYRNMSFSKVAQGIGTVAASLVFGLVKLSSLGLILGYVAGQVLAILALTPSIRGYISAIRVISRSDLSRVAKRYRNFALLSLPADLINAVTNQLPVLFISNYFNNAIVGHYNLTFRVTLGPLSIISTAVLDVFKEQAARDYARTGSCVAVFLKTGKLLALVGIPALLLFYPVAPRAFAIVFGPEWRTAGEYTQILTPLLITRFIASPLSYVLYIAEKQIFDLAWQIVLLLLVSFSFVMGGIHQDVTVGLRWFSWFYSAMYLVYLYLSFRFTVRRA